MKRVLLVAAVSICITACGSKTTPASSTTPTPTTPTPTTPTPPVIQATVWSMPAGSNVSFGNLETVKVCSDASCATPASNATVTVSGLPLVCNPAHLQYEGNQVIALGSAINLQVGLSGATYSASTTQFTLAETPVIDLPLPGTAWNAGVDNTITYHGGFAPRVGFAYLSAVFDANGKSVYPASKAPAEFSLDFTSTVIPKNWTSVAGNYQLDIGIGTSGIGNGGAAGLSITGAAAGSSLWVGSLGAARAVVVF